MWETCKQYDPIIKFNLESPAQLLVRKISPRSTMTLTSILRLCVLLDLVIFRFTAVIGEAQPQVPCFFVFGDSLVDNGNNNHLQTTAKATYLPYGIDFPTGPSGRFTNGRNIVDVIGQLLGFDKSIPPFANSTDQDVLLGINYGSGGAGILDESGSHLQGHVISLKEQLRNHDMAISRLAKLVGSRKAAREHLKSCLYYVGMGNNDYLTNYLPKYYAPLPLPQITPPIPNSSPHSSSNNTFITFESDFFLSSSSLEYN